MLQVKNKEKKALKNSQQSSQSKIKKPCYFVV